MVGAPKWVPFRTYRGMETNPYSTPRSQLSHSEWSRRREESIAWTVDRTLLWSTAIGITLFHIACMAFGRWGTVLLTLLTALSIFAFSFTDSISKRDRASQR
jgi:hypothetical protein